MASRGNIKKVGGPKKCSKKGLISAMKKMGPWSAVLIDRAAKHGPCEACGFPESHPKRKTLCRDHRHGSDTYRGLLCFRCNLAVGLMGDDPQIARDIALYLERPPPLGDDCDCFPEFLEQEARQALNKR